MLNGLGKAATELALPVEALAPSSARQDSGSIAGSEEQIAVRVVALIRPAMLEAVAQAAEAGGSRGKRSHQTKSACTDFIMQGEDTGVLFIA